MKRIVFLLFLFPMLSMACQDHPTTQKNQPLWVQALLKAAHPNHADHKKLEPKSSSVQKKEASKKPASK